MSGDKTPQLADVQAMTRKDLRNLVEALLKMTASESTTPADSPSHDLLVGTDGKRSVVVVNRVSEGSALHGISLPALAAAAKSANVASVVVATTGAIDAERRADLERALAKVRNATGIHVDIRDGADLLSLIRSDDTARARFFPRAEEAEAVAVAENVPAGLVKAAVAVSPETPATSESRRAFGIVRLVIATAVVVTLVAVPMRVDAYSARWTAAVGLGLLATVAILGWLSSARFGRSLERFHGPLIEQLLPLPDQTSVLRRITTANPGILALLAMIGLLSLVRLLRWVIISGILGFIAFFTFVFLLIWGVDPGICKTGAEGCRGAFSNVGSNPSVGDFVYLAAQSAFFQAPDGLGANSRVARAAVTGEFVCAAALLAGFAASVGMPHGIWSRD
jgi:hypothetical protein